MHEYDLIADWYANDRSRSIGVREALESLATLPRGARVLDLGCGNGVPLTAALVDAGYSVVGLDSSNAMLARFHRNLADTAVVRADARQCPFKPGTFDAAVSWGMMFHMTRAEQSLALANLTHVLKPGAPFHFTAAEIPTVANPDPGITGTMNGVTFHYYAVASYRELLAAHGFELIERFDDPGANSYFVARKS